jgi:hypothetical protein
MVLITLAYKLTLKTTVMKTFVKNYIGKGRQVEGLEIVKITLKMKDLVKFSHQYKDEEYISLEVAKLQNPDNFDNTHTVYVNRLEEQQEPAPAEPEKKKKSRKSSKKVTADLPF